MKLDNRTSGEFVTDMLREEIISGRIPDKTELSQEWIAERAGVSRMPIREALSCLESEGLVERLDNRRIIVLGFDRELRASRLDVLACLEIEAARRIWNDADARASLGQYLERHSLLTPSDEECFHAMVFERTGDRFLILLYRRMLKKFLAAVLNENSEADRHRRLAPIKNAFLSGAWEALFDAIRAYYAAV
ncbi:MAG: GntR family transcriptional regulator [Synergistaceae bacterium]|nr:GntR family transcriptional regulator [Synergistaceae bacterium]